MRERVADVIVPITGGRLDMLAKATATLHRAVEVQAYVWGVGRKPDSDIRSSPAHGGRRRDAGVQAQAAEGGEGHQSGRPEGRGEGRLGLPGSGG